MAHNLTPHQLHHLGLSSALETMADAVAETSGIDLKITIEPIDGLLPVPAEINLYRIVQEGLTNLVRHSGALTAELHVRRDGPVVRVTLTDSGRGFRVKRDSGGRIVAGFGLTGMAERARILDGTLEVHSAPGYGTHMELAVPVTLQEPDPAPQTAAATTGS
jgi:signal transduction histidine kinase